MIAYIDQTSAKRIDGLSFEEYKAIDRVNQSYLKTLISKSPLHAEHEKANPYESTSMSFGTLAHSIVFGELNPWTDLIAYDGTRRGAAWESFKKDGEARDLKCVTKPELEAAREIGNKVPYWLAREIDDSAKEVTILFDYILREDGSFDEIVVPCKARIDLLGEHVIRDYKTTSQGIGKREFGKMIGTYFLDLQAAFYQKAVQALTKSRDPLPFQWIVQESSAPYDLAGYEATDENLANGNSWLAAALSLYGECKRDGQFRGTWNGEFAPVDCPAWHLYEPEFDMSGVKEVSEL